MESGKVPRTRPQNGPEQETDPQPRPRMEWVTNKQGPWWVQTLSWGVTQNLWASVSPAKKVTERPKKLFQGMERKTAGKMHKT